MKINLADNQTFNINGQIRHSSYGNLPAFTQEVRLQITNHSIKIFNKNKVNIIKVDSIDSIEFYDMNTKNSYTFMAGDNVYCDTDSFQQLINLIA